jgi:thymidylate synthase (FAD)
MEKRNEKMNNVKIIGITKPIIDGITTAEEFIAYCARVSNPSNQMNTQTTPKLLNYCVKNKHWSIFETVNIVMSVETTRDIARQILRHRSFSFQEYSQRYADPTKDLDFVVREARLQDTKNRQNSIDTNDDTLQEEWKSRQKNLIIAAKSEYEWAIRNGIAKEQARTVLPEGNTLSKIYMNGTLRSWITYISLREKNGTQKEHQEIALQCKKIIKELFPSVSDALSGSNGEWNL